MNMLVVSLATALALPDSFNTQYYACDTESMPKMLKPRSQAHYIAVELMGALLGATLTDLILKKHPLRYKERDKAMG